MRTLKTLEYLIGEVGKEIKSETKELVGSVWKEMYQEIKKPKVYKSVGATTLATYAYYSLLSAKPLLTCAIVGGIAGFALLSLIGAYSYYKKR